MTTQHISLTVNGEAHEADVEPRLLLVHLLRDNFMLTGTHIGCDTSNCGACTVHVNGESAKSCTMLAVQADGSSVTTIEGMGQPGSLHPIQQAFAGLFSQDPRTNRPVLSIPLPESITQGRLTKALAGLLGVLGRPV